MPLERMGHNRLQKDAMTIPKVADIAQLFVAAVIVAASFVEEAKRMGKRVIMNETEMFVKLGSLELPWLWEGLCSYLRCGHDSHCRCHNGD